MKTHINPDELIVYKRYAEYVDTTPGDFWYENRRLCSGIELLYKDNAPNISAIPLGVYPFIIQYSPKFKRKLLTILNVPSRTGIRVHPANYSHELEGCIAPATSIVMEYGKLKGNNSRVAYDLLEQVHGTYGVRFISIERSNSV